MRTQGERIKKLRKSKGVTQRELANRLGISEQAISKWEKNLSNPSTKNLLQISKIFGVSITYFYQDEETQSKKIAREGGMASLRELYKIGRGPSSSHTVGPIQLDLSVRALDLRVSILLKAIRQFFMDLFQKRARDTELIT